MKYDSEGVRPALALSISLIVNCTTVIGIIPVTACLPRPTEILFFYVAIKPRNTLRTKHFLLYVYITTGHRHSEVYLGISVDFYDSVGQKKLGFSWSPTSNSESLIFCTLISALLENKYCILLLLLLLQWQYSDRAMLRVSAVTKKKLTERVKNSHISIQFIRRPRAWKYSNAHGKGGRYSYRIGLRKKILNYRTNIIHLSD